MNTPAHALINLALLGGGQRRGASGAVLAGAVLPDAPMFVFFAWERGVQGHPQVLLWNELYYAEHWQAFFDVFNSLPLAAVGLALGLALRRTPVVLCFASVLLHCALDLPLHHDDAHRHFFPVSDWRFESPVSYWDPHRFGAWVSAAETAAMGVAAAVLWRRSERRAVRVALVCLVALQTLGWVGFYAL